MDVEDPRLGTVLQGRYRIVERLAAGGMGVVYRGERLRLERQVAIKFLHASVAAQEKSMKRFEREALIMGRLAHPHCVSVIDIGVEEAPYIVMDYISGVDLKEILEAGPMPLPRAIHIVRQILAGLAHAHALGVVHRDIKPANVMIAHAEGTRDHVYVLDFGLAKFREESLGDDLTGSAALIGTPSYMAPEQARGQKASVASDVYSTGVLCFEMLTGQNPFKAENPFSTLLNHQNVPVPSLCELAPDAGFSRELDRALQTAMAKDPEQRFGSALAFAGALDAIMDPALPGQAPVTAAAGPSTRDSEGRAPALALDATRELAAVRAATEPAHAAAEPAHRADAEPAAQASEPAFAQESIRIESMADQELVAAREAPPTVPVPTLPEDMEPERSRRSRGLILVLLPVLSALVTWYVIRLKEQADEARRALEADGPGLVTTIENDSGPEPPDSGANQPGPVVVVDASAPFAQARDAAATQVLMDAQAAPVVDAGANSAASAVDADVAQTGGEAGGGELEDGPEDGPLPAPESVQVASVRDVVLLIQKGRREEAITGIHKLLPTNQKSAYLRFLLGNLYFEKKWWGKGLEAYTQAVANNPVYGRKAIINNNAILALSSERARAQATHVLTRVLGKNAVPYLRKAAASHPNMTVRKQAAALVERMAGKGK